MDDGGGSENGIRRGVTEPAHLGNERTTLMGFLARQRDLVAWKVSAASEESLRSARTPSGLTLPGIVRHLEDAERWWLSDVFAGEDELTYASSDEDSDGDFRVPDGVAVADLIASYADECLRSDKVIESAPSLDAVSARRSFTLRWIILHLVEETARHLGHMDLLREQADGAVGEEPPPAGEA